MEEFDFYISSRNHLIIKEYNIDFLIDLTQSSIPSMPEAVETSVRIAGRDGDIVLATNYEPIPFNIVCYTDDNLTPEEKTKIELNLDMFMHKIKNNTIKFGIEKDNKFYEVKYNGALTTINFPKHLQFSIPFKSSESFAMDINKKIIIGNNTVVSNTVEETGAIFTIKGPAQTPIISLNDYQMHYNNVILEGAKLIIDSNNSTVTLISSENVITNAMRYYNHQFPKIKNGNNQLKVSSGIEDESQVTVEWYDLKF